jgi:hypothetical protein
VAAGERWTRRAVLGAGVSGLACAGVGGQASVPSSGAPRTRGPDWGPGTAVVPTGPARPLPVTPPPSAPWLRGCGGLYAPTCESAGSGLIAFASRNARLLPDRLASFRALPTLLDEARALGTDVVYLVDWYDGGGQRVAWQNKGDYLPNDALGGAPALAEGLAAVRAAGGRVLLYLEPFIAHRDSAVGRAFGEAWCIRDAAGAPAEAYPDFYTLCPATPWADHVVARATAAAGWGAAGVFLDSYGLQRGWRCHNPNHGHPVGEPSVFQEGVIALATRVRAAVRGIDPDGVVIVEGPEHERLLGAVDGALDWGLTSLVARPGWAAVGATDLFTVGWSLDDAHQILALGSKLALPPAYLDPPPRSAVGWIDQQTERPAPTSAKELRLYADRVFRGVHQVRNAGIASQMRVPPLDDLTPRRFEPGLDDWPSLVTQLRARAAVLDEAVDGAVVPVATWVRALVQARAHASTWIDTASSVTALPAPADGLAWRFDGPQGAVVSLVNLGNLPATFDNPVPGQVDAVGGAVSGAAVTLGGHRLALLVPRA